MTADSGSTSKRRPTVAEERAAAQEAKRAARAQKAAAAGPAETAPGVAIVRTSVGGTIVFTFTAVAAATIGFDADSVTAAMVLAAAVALGLFAVGSAVFLVALYLAAQRSRESEIAVGSLFFLADVAPSTVRAWLLGSLAAQVVVGVGTAAVRPFSALAFGTLVPMFGLGLAGLWGALHGSFPPRRPETRGRR